MVAHLEKIDALAMQSPRPVRRFFGLVAAFVHFGCVELRPWVFIYLSGQDILTTVITRSFKSLNPQTNFCRLDGSSECNGAEADDELSDLLWKATTSLDLKYRQDAICFPEISYNDDNYGTFVLAAFAILLIIPVLALIIFFFIEAFSSSNFNFNSGSYFVFTMKLQKRRVYKIIVWMVVVAVVLMWLFGLVVNVIQKACTFGQYIQQNLMQIAVFCCGIYALLSTVDDTEFYSWNEKLLCDVSFKRPWYTLILKANADLYNEVILAGVAAARNDRGPLETLATNAETLSEALGLQVAKLEDAI